MKIFLLVLSSFFLSPLIKTGLPVKQFTWINEIIALLVFSYYFLNGRLFKDKIHIIEIILIGLALSLTISNLFGYVFLNVHPALIDFYQVFNLFLFIIYFRIGKNSSRFDIKTPSIPKLHLTTNRIFRAMARITFNKLKNIYNPGLLSALSRST